MNDNTHEATNNNKSYRQIITTAKTDIAEQVISVTCFVCLHDNFCEASKLYSAVKVNRQSNR